MKSTLATKTSLLIALFAALASVQHASADTETGKKEEYAFFDLVQGGKKGSYYQIDVRVPKDMALCGPLTAVFKRVGAAESLFELDVKGKSGSDLVFQKRCAKSKISSGKYVLSFYQGSLTSKDTEDGRERRNYRGQLARQFTFSVGGPLKAHVMAYYHEKTTKQHTQASSIIVVGQAKGFPFRTLVDIRYRYGNDGHFSSWFKTRVNEKEQIETTLQLRKDEMTADYVQLECSVNLADQSPRNQDWFARNKGLDRAKRHSLEAMTVILPFKKLGPFRTSLFRIRLGAQWNSRLSFSGTKTGLPKGTRIDIRFTRDGNRQHIAWYRAINDASGSFRGQSSVFKKSLPPGEYKVQVWFKMRTQNRVLRRWFTLNKGWNRQHQLLLETLTIRVGNQVQETVFLEETRATLRSYARAIEKNLEALESLYKQRDNPMITKKEKTAKRIVNSVGVQQRSFYSWNRKYLALPFEKERQDISSLISLSLRLSSRVLSPGLQLEKRIKDLQLWVAAVVKRLD